MDANEAWRAWLDGDARLMGLTVRDGFLAGFAAGQIAALNDAADDIQALHPGEVKNSVEWLRARAVELANEGESTYEADWHGQDAREENGHA